MMNWLRRLFTDRRKGVIYPFRPVINAMHEKDAKLAREVGPLSPATAIRRWREVYPEDFAELRD